MLLIDLQSLSHLDMIFIHAPSVVVVLPVAPLALGLERRCDEAGAYVLNFIGHLTMASVKNFQLLNGEDQVLQFGRVGKDEFSMDVKWPLSLFQAFAVCLSSFDSKLGCD